MSDPRPKELIRALKKLNRFSDAIKNNTEIWESLKRAVKTGEVLELDKPQFLGNVVNLNIL
ncbi:hypothetical protein LCGC14_1361730 [marine sediment metagenome]|uniref:Uncharacterized protein n=1 Tax=marine sediment metagenome TaxID=412755 RepID=A0A0F9K8M8_9ZZZZ